MGETSVPRLNFRGIMHWGPARPVQFEDDMPAQGRAERAARRAIRNEWQPPQVDIHTRGITAQLRSSRIRVYPQPSERNPILDTGIPTSSRKGIGVFPSEAAAERDITTGLGVPKDQGNLEMSRKKRIQFKEDEVESKGHRTLGIRTEMPRYPRPLPQVRVPAPDKRVSARERNPINHTGIPGDSITRKSRFAMPTARERNVITGLGVEGNQGKLIMASKARENDTEMKVVAAAAERNLGKRMVTLPPRQDPFTRTLRTRYFQRMDSDLSGTLGGSPRGRGIESGRSQGKRTHFEITHKD